MKLLLGLILLLLPGSPAWALSGDPEAVAMARKMIQTMGGREQWQSARWVYAREDAYFADRSSPADAQYWRRADRPEQRARSVGPDWSREGAWNSTKGYLIADGKRTELRPDELRQRAGWWPGEIYMMYVRLAREDPGLRLIKTGERSFRAVDESTGSNLGEFTVDFGGALARWRYGFGINQVDYVYGPLKPFGPIKVPAWGALNDGSFRFYYTDFRLISDDEPIGAPEL